MARAALVAAAVVATTAHAKGGKGLGAAWCEADYRDLQADVLALAADERDPESWRRDVIRLAFLDALDGGGGGEGGSDGCLALDAAWTAPDLWSQNSRLYGVYAAWRSRAGLSAADFLVAAANACVRNATRLDPPYRFGRADRPFCPEAETRLPAAATCAEVRRVMVDRMALGWPGAIALLGAAVPELYDFLATGAAAILPRSQNDTAPAWSWEPDAFSCLGFDADDVAAPCCATALKQPPPACPDVVCARGNVLDPSGAGPRAAKAFRGDSPVWSYAFSNAWQAATEAGHDDLAGFACSGAPPTAAPTVHVHHASKRSSSGAAASLVVAISYLAAIAFAAAGLAGAYVVWKRRQGDEDAWTSPFSQPDPFSALRDPNRPRRVELSSPASAAEYDDDDDDEFEETTMTPAMINPFSPVAAAPSKFALGEEEKQLVGGMVSL